MGSSLKRSLGTTLEAPFSTATAWTLKPPQTPTEPAPWRPCRTGPGCGTPHAEGGCCSVPPLRFHSVYAVWRARGLWRAHLHTSQGQRGICAQHVTSQCFFGAQRPGQPHHTVVCRLDRTFSPKCHAYAGTTRKELLPHTIKRKVEGVCTPRLTHPLSPECQAIHPRCAAPTSIYHVLGVFQVAMPGLR